MKQSNAPVLVTIANAELNEIVQSATGLFGGCTAWVTQGGWKDPASGAICIEPGVTVEIHALWEDVAKWASEKCKMYHEQCAYQRQGDRVAFPGVA